MTTVDNTIKSFEQKAEQVFERINDVSYENQKRVLEAFRKYRVSSQHFAPSTGYGYNDAGRETLESIYADVFGGDDALVRSSLVSGTHALSQCLMAVLKPGDTLISAIGPPYDTLGKVINGANGLVNNGVNYRELPIGSDGGCDLESLVRVARMKPRMIMLQRSRGYNWDRRSITIEEIEKAISVVKKESEETIVLVDNCYGEFVENMEPPMVGADLTAGSLIKNPGGGLAVCGGYVIGSQALVEKVADHLVAPGLGKEIGPSLYDLRTVYQGLFMSPHVVCESLKGAVIGAALFESTGLEVSPRWDDARGDIVQAIKIGDAAKLEKFVQTVQFCSPVDSYVRPEFSPMPGYDEQVIMAAGTFVQGSSIEISCDAPMRKPYAAYLQGGLSYQHNRFVIEELTKLAASWNLI
ncbi:MAG: aminotransferase class I/II-fold pyridoxal phosphate-dependent enzyme [Candidatus Saccharibacteria bacterium]